MLLGSLGPEGRRLPAVPVALEPSTRTDGTRAAWPGPAAPEAASHSAVLAVVAVAVAPAGSVAADLAADSVPAAVPAVRATSPTAPEMSPCPPGVSATVS